MTEFISNSVILPATRGPAAVDTNVALPRARRVHPTPKLFWTETGSATSSPRLGDRIFWDRNIDLSKIVDETRCAMDSCQRNGPALCRLQMS